MQNSWFNIKTTKSEALTQAIGAIVVRLFNPVVLVIVWQPDSVAIA
jgi:hypothetical protein